MLTSVQFRGESVDVEVTHDGGYEWDTNAHDIDWHFYGLTAEQYDALKVTDAEEADIYRQLCESSNDRADYYDPAEWRDWLRKAAHETHPGRNR